MKNQTVSYHYRFLEILKEDKEYWKKELMKYEENGWDATHIKEAIEFKNAQIKWCNEKIKKYI